MNPFFIFLLVCTIVAIIYWFRNATTKQGITALKGLFICLGCLFIILLVTGRLPLLTGIPLLLMALYRKIALTKLLIPFIRLLAGPVSQPDLILNREQALAALHLKDSPSREEIVQAHRRIMRDNNTNHSISKHRLAQIDAAREPLIQQSENSD